MHVLGSQEKQLGFEIFPELRILIREGVYRVPDLSLFVEQPTGEIPNELGSPARVAIPLPNGSILDLNFDELFSGL